MGRKSSFTAEQDAAIMARPPLPAAQLAEAMGRTSTAIYTRRSYLTNGEELRRRVRSYNGRHLTSKLDSKLEEVKALAADPTVTKTEALARLGVAVKTLESVLIRHDIVWAMGRYSKLNERAQAVRLLAANPAVSKKQARGILKVSQKTLDDFLAKADLEWMSPGKSLAARSTTVRALAKDPLVAKKQACQLFNVSLSTLNIFLDTHAISWQ